MVGEMPYRKYKSNLGKKIGAFAPNKEEYKYAPFGLRDKDTANKKNVKFLNETLANFY